MPSESCDSVDEEPTINLEVTTSQPEDTTTEGQESPIIEDEPSEGDISGLPTGDNSSEDEVTEAESPSLEEEDESEDEQILSEVADCYNPATFYPYPPYTVGCDDLLDHDDYRVFRNDFE